jgi:hypothetical protein
MSLMRLIQGVTVSQSTSTSPGMAAPRATPCKRAKNEFSNGVVFIDSSASMMLLCSASGTGAGTNSVKVAGVEVEMLFSVQPARRRSCERNIGI